MKKYFNLTDIELLTLMNSSNHAAFEVLYQRYCEPITNFALRLTGNDQPVAQDLVQETFISLYERKKEPGPGFSFERYLFRIIKNKFIDYLRKNDKDMKFLNNFRVFAEESTCTTDSRLLFNELVENIREGIDRLPKGRKKIYLKSRVEELTHDEIAEEFNISPATVRSHIKRANKFLRKFLKLFLILYFVHLLLLLNKFLNFFS